MTRISYRMADSKVVEIDVPDDVAEVTVDFEREERNAARRQRWRKECSIEAMAAYGAEIADAGQDILGNVIEREQTEGLQAALAHLTDKQRDLVQRVYFENRSLAEIGREKGISKQALSQQLATIHKKLKKLL